MAVIMAPRSGGGLFGTIGSLLSLAQPQLAPWIMGANALYGASNGNYGQAVKSTAPLFMNAETMPYAWGRPYNAPSGFDMNRYMGVL